MLTDRTGLRGGEWDHVIDFWAHSPRTLRILYTPSGENDLYMAMMAPVADTESSAIPINPAPWIACFPQLEPALSRLGDKGRYDVYETTKLDHWSVGRVAIVGDSAHAMPPTLAQGRAARSATRSASPARSTSATRSRRRWRCGSGGSGH